MEQSSQEFVSIVDELDAADLWFLQCWAEMIAPAQRVFVVESSYNSTGPLVLVGAMAPGA